MPERLRIIDNIDTNQNGIIDENEYRNFKNVIKNPKDRKELVESIDNNQEILLLLKPAVEDMVSDIILEGKKDKESMMIIKIYALKYLDIDEELIGPIDGEYNDLSESLLIIIEQGIDPLVFIGRNLEQYTIQTFDGFSKYGVVFSPQVMNVYGDKTNSIEDILHKTTPKDRFEKILGTDIGKQIWNDSLRYWDYTNICKAIGKDIDSIEDKEKLEIKDFYDIYEDSIKKIKYLESHLYGNIITGNATIYKKEQLREDTNEIIKNLAYEYGKLAMKDGISNDEVIRLSIGIVDIKLDFSNMEGGDYENNFDAIYRDTNIEHFIDAIETVVQDVRENPKKRAIDILAILAGGTAVVILSAGTEGMGFVQSGVTYTAIHEAVKTSGYGLIHMNEKGYSMGNFKDGFDEGIGYSNANGEYMEDSHFLISKGFEYTINIGLFLIFKGGDKASKIVGFEKLNERLSVGQIKKSIKSMTTKQKVSLLGDKLAFEGTKVGIETSLFTSLHIGIGSIEPALISFLENGGDIEQAKKEFTKHFDELLKPENLIQSLIYNYMFISAVKLAGSPINPILKYQDNKRYIRLEDNSRKIIEIREKVLTENEKLVQEIQRLESKGYKIELNEIKGEPKISIIKPNGKKIEFLWDLEFTELKIILGNLNKLGKEYYITQLDIYKLGENTQKTPENEVREKIVKKKGKEESGRGSKVSESGLSLIDKTLQDVLTGFRLGANKLTKGFQTLIGKDFSQIGDIGMIREEVGKQIKVEVERYLKREKLEPKEIDFITKKTEEFEIALTEKILRDKINELNRKKGKNPLSEKDKSQLEDLTKQLKDSIFSSKYGEPEVMNRLMGEFVDRLNLRLRNEFSKKILKDRIYPRMKIEER